MGRRALLLGTPPALVPRLLVVPENKGQNDFLEGHARVVRFELLMQPQQAQCSTSPSHHQTAGAADSCDFPTSDALVTAAALAPF